MPRSRERTLSRVIGRGIKWLLIATMTAVVALIVIAFSVKWYLDDRLDREIEASVHDSVQSLAAELHAGMSDDEILKLNGRRDRTVLDIQRNPHVTTVFAVIQGYGRGLLGMHEVEFCYKFLVHPRPAGNVTIQRVDRCPPGRFTVVPSPTS